MKAERVGIKARKVLTAILIFPLLLLGGEREVSPKEKAESPDNRQIGDGFIRYISDQHGDVAWEMRGSAAQFPFPQIVEIFNLVATSFDKKIGELTIEVENVFYDLQSKQARAERQRVTIRRGNMVLTGKGIVWMPGSNQVRVMEDIKVLIKENDNQGLFPL